MKTFLSISILTAFFAIACGGGEKKTETPTGGDGDGDGTATPVGTDNGTDTGTTAADPELVAKGAKVYEEYCSTCHGDGGEGDDKTPAIKGDGALASFASDDALFEYTKKEMPKDGPGELSDDEYKAVVAWMRN